jgi:LmbE family N-acetylglucosaminyl deacetylase
VYPPFNLRASNYFAARQSAGGNVNRVSQKPSTAIFLSALLLAFVQPRASAQFPPAPGTGPGLAETVEAIDSARVTTRILYITAHPDDESATLLTYLARGLHADVALLTLTRGEGGQNDLGPEQAPQLGLIRTQELHAATRGYGIKLFFGGAPDFGYSKTAEETQKIWGDAVLGDMVCVIRTYRPDIVINGWGGVHGSHGHHQTSGLWTPRAVALAADANAFPEQLTKEGLAVWGSSSNPVQVLDTERGGVTSATVNSYTLPVDEISPLWGKTWRDIGLDAFANHRSQGIAGFLGSPFLRRPLVLVREDGKKLDPPSLAEPLRDLDTGAVPQAMVRPTLSQAESAIQRAHDAALSLKWEESAREMASAAKQVESLFPAIHAASSPLLFFELTGTQRRIERALALIAGVKIRAEADREALVAGESFGITAEARCRVEAGCKLGALRLVLPPGMSEIKPEKDAAKSGEFKVQVEAPAPALTAWDKLQPEPPPLVFAQQEVTVSGYQFNVKVPVTHIAATSSHVDRVPLRIVPAYTLAVDPKQAVEVLAKQRKPFDVLLRVHSYATLPGKISVGLDVPQGWTSSAPMPLEFAGAGDQYAKFTVTPPTKLAAGDYTVAAFAKRGEQEFTESSEPLPSLPAQYWEEPAKCLVHAFDVNVPDNLRVGYITAESEPIPEALRRLGIQVETLDAQALAFSDLSKFDAIVVGVRAYELRPELPGANQRLLDYVSKGSTLVVQYNRDFIWDRLQPAPYPAKIGNPTPRITDENSPVKFLKPDDPLLNTPNKITLDDFKGWVQERGLYYWSQFDTKYTPLLAMNDPGESELNGALVYAKYGQGTYIYTGIAFFRQLPEGVPGAYRLFVNLLSASRAK